MEKVALAIGSPKSLMVWVALGSVRLPVRSPVVRLTWPSNVPWGTTTSMFRLLRWVDALTFQWIGMIVSAEAGEALNSPRLPRARTSSTASALRRLRVCMAGCLLDVVSIRHRREGTSRSIRVEARQERSTGGSGRSRRLAIADSVSVTLNVTDVNIRCRPYDPDVTPATRIRGG